MSEKTFLAAALVGAMWVSAAVADVAQAERGLDLGAVIPSRTLKMQNAPPAPFPSPDGLTVLVFWSTWSPRSSAALALWKDYQEKYGDKGVRVLTVNADHQTMSDEDRRVVSEFMQG